MKKSRFGFSWGSKESTQTYTPAERKGEVNELKALLRDPVVERDQNRRRDVLKKVLGFMTLGVDTSSLFTEMILACVTKDLVQKKMVYFYLCVHSETNSDLAILAINTLQKDCKDESPLVRGLALRSLASLRLPQIAEYLVPTLKICLTDKAPYVRKTSILATLKLFHVSPDQFRQMGLVDKMYGMLRDNDPMVCSNALAVLQEVLRDEGGIQINKSILYFLLNRLRDMTEWQQVGVLNLTLKYTPANEDELFDIMNLLEERLKGNNSAVIIATSQVFLHLTQNLPTVHKQVFDRLRDPLLTLMATSHTYEVSYAVMCHIKLLAEREPRCFAKNYKDFFCRVSDPTFIKCVKIDILTLVAAETSATEIVAELVEYVSDSNVALSRMAVDAMAKVALKIDSCAKKTLEFFLDLLGMDIEHVRGQTLVAMKDFLRKYSSIDTVRPFLSQVVKSYKEMNYEDETSKIALVWVLGEFGEHIEDAPYLLEAMSAAFASETPSMRIEMLTALMKLFFKRPPEVQPVLGKVFAVAINDFSDADVHDRALMYYRLLKLNPKAAAQVVCTPKATVAMFAEDDTADVRDRLFEEFNTFSVIYGQPSGYYMKEMKMDDSDDEEVDEEEEEDDDGEAGLLRSEDAAPHGTAAAAPSALQALNLDPDYEIEPPIFQQKWSLYATVQQLTFKFKAVPGQTQLENELQDHDIFILATGQQGTLLKVYLYAKMASVETTFLVEMLIQATGAAQATLKCPDTAAGAMFAKHLTKAVSAFT